MTRTNHLGGPSARRHTVSPRSCRYLSALVGVGLSSLPAAGQVTIEGGLDRQLGIYVWTVTNGGDKPVTSIEIPHYRGSIFTPPEGWEHEMTNKVGLGMRDEPGAIRARAASRRSAIRPGQSAIFSLSFSSHRTSRGSQIATVGFDDGTSLQVSGVWVPWMVPWLRRYSLFVGLALAFAIFVAVQAVRGRRKRPAGATVSAE